MNACLRARTWLSTGDRWIPGLFVGGFLVVLAANIVMIWVALGTFGGLTTADYYDRGRTYNQTLATAEGVADTGWTATLETEALGGGRVLVRAVFVDDEGRPLNDAAVTAHFVRPADDDADFELTLVQASAGSYEAETEAPADGLWQVRLFATRDGAAFAAEERVTLLP